METKQYKLLKDFHKAIYGTDRENVIYIGNFLYGPTIYEIISPNV
jgi:hypothetical protein